MSLASCEMGLPSLFMALTTIRAEMIPSPVVWWSKNIMCPDPSPPIRAPLASISLRTYLSPTLVVTCSMPSPLKASPRPILLMTVLTTKLLASRPSSFMTLAQTLSIWSPDSTPPVSSTVVIRSPSPSKANPTSALFFMTCSASLSGYSEPQPALILMPSGSAERVSTLAPSSIKVEGATLKVAPLAQSRIMLIPFIVLCSWKTSFRKTL